MKSAKKSVPQARKQQKAKKARATTATKAKKQSKPAPSITKKKVTRAKPGQPTAFKPEYVVLAHNYCLLGATDKDLARLFDVTEATINNWKDKHPQFFESIKAGKDEADAKVAESLFKRATGYSHPDVHVSNYQGDITLTPLTKHYPPDPTSGIFWLKNRQRDKWRERLDHSSDPENPLFPPSTVIIIPAKNPK